MGGSALNYRSFRRCPLLAQSGHLPLHPTCLLLTQSELTTNTDVDDGATVVLHRAFIYLYAPKANRRFQPVVENWIANRDGRARAGRIAMKTIVPVVTAVVLAVALMPASAASRHNKRDSQAATAAQPQIACTIVGCIPVSRGCHPESGYSPDGTPTGFDVVTCPNYTLYGRNISNY